MKIGMMHSSYHLAFVAIQDGRRRRGRLAFVCQVANISSIFICRPNASFQIVVSEFM